MPAPPLSNTFEGGTEDATITTAGSGGDSGDAFDEVVLNGSFPIWDSEHSRGIMAMKCNNGAGTASSRVSWHGLGSITTDVFIRAYCWFPSGTLTGQTSAILRIANNAGSNSGFVGFQVAGGGTLETLNAAQAVVTEGSVAVTRDAWVRIEARILSHTTAGEIECRLYNDPDSLTISETLSGTGLVLATNSDRFSAGNTRAAGLTNYSFWVDDMAVSATDWIGPSEAGAPPAPSDDPPIGMLGRGAGW